LRAGRAVQSAEIRKCAVEFHRPDGIDLFIIELPEGDEMAETAAGNFCGGSCDHFRRRVDTRHAHPPLRESDRIGPRAAVELQNVRAGWKMSKKRSLDHTPEVSRDTLLLELSVIH